jgi:tRNA pseudouridine38-40 synthase
VRVTARSFLYHMVRNVVGALHEVGAGDMAPGDMVELLARRDRSRAPRMAPAHGLYLVDVHYPPREGEGEGEGEGEQREEEVWRAEAAAARCADRAAAEGEAAAGAGVGVGGEPKMTNGAAPAPPRAAG